MEELSQSPVPSHSPLPRANVLGVGVHAINMQSVEQIVYSALQNRAKGYVCVTGVHGVIEAQRDEQFKQILNRAFLVTPDGTPTVWVGRLQGHRNMGRVFGPELMIRICEASVPWGTRHFLYGGDEGVAEQLRENLTSRIRGLQIVGTYTPPFRTLTEDERRSLIAQVVATKPDIIWVGLSTPKQEKFMAEYLPLLDTTLLFGVGAAFDFHTGKISDCSDWVKSAGLQWAHRLFQEPGRLWKRYLFNNSRFLIAITAQLTGLHRYPLNDNTSS